MVEREVTLEDRVHVGSSGAMEQQCLCHLFATRLESDSFGFVRPLQQRVPDVVDAGHRIVNVLHLTERDWDGGALFGPPRHHLVELVACDVIVDFMLVIQF